MVAKMIVKIDDVSKSYNKHSVIKAISLDIEKGERVVILGPSGCGKTTLLRIVAGFIHPDQGKVIIDGNVVRIMGNVSLSLKTDRWGWSFKTLPFGLICLIIKTLNLD